MLTIIEMQRIPARLDKQGETCTLRDLFSPEDGAAIERWLRSHCAPDQICDECGKRMGGEVPAEESELEHQHVFFVTPEVIESFFLCDWCGENWESRGEDGLPNITAKMRAARSHQRTVA